MFISLLRQAFSFIRCHIVYAIDEKLPFGSCENKAAALGENTLAGG